MSRVIAALVELLAEEADADAFNAGSTTFKRQDLSRGFEPDECFYFADKAGHVREIVGGRGNTELDAGASLRASPEAPKHRSGGPAKHSPPGPGTSVPSA